MLDEALVLQTTINHYRNSVIEMMERDGYIAQYIDLSHLPKQLKLWDDVNPHPPYDEDES